MNKGEYNCILYALLFDLLDDKSCSSWKDLEIRISRQAPMCILYVRLDFTLVLHSNARTIKICVMRQLLHRFQPNFARWQRPPNALRGWSKQEYNKCKVADSRHLEKPKKWPYLRKVLTDWHEIWHCDANWLSEMYQMLKIWTLKF